MIILSVMWTSEAVPMAFSAVCASVSPDGGQRFVRSGTIRNTNTGVF